MDKMATKLIRRLRLLYSKDIEDDYDLMDRDFETDDIVAELLRRGNKVFYYTIKRVFPLSHSTKNDRVTWEVILRSMGKDEGAVTLGEYWTEELARAIATDMNKSAAEIAMKNS